MVRKSVRTSEIPEHAAKLLEAVRAKMVRTHCITNAVVQKLTADGLASLGAMPSMTANALEITSFMARCDTLLVNLGTLDGNRIEVIGTAVKKANDLGKPWVLDPVLCDVSSERRDLANDLLRLRPAVVRGNPMEIAVMRDIPGPITHVITGKIDHVTRHGRTITIANGHPFMSRVTGTGCLCGAMIAAFLGVEEDTFLAAASALLVLNIAAELAGPISRGPGSMAVKLLDELNLLSPEAILELAKVADA